MSIQLQFYSVIIPIDNIERCSEIGGFRGIVKKQQVYFGRRVLVDDYLYRDGAMEPSGVEEIVRFWKEQGLQPIGIKDGKQYWKDLCVISQHEGLLLPCEWLEYDSMSDWPNGIVSMKGKKSADVVLPFIG